MLQKIIATTTALALLTGVAAAEDAVALRHLLMNQEMDTSFPASRARLAQQGYRDMQTIAGSAYKLRGSDG